MEENTKIKQININEIIENKYNSKIHNKKQIEEIKKSILNYGYNDLIEVDENNFLLCGHGRLKALKELNFKNINVICIEGLSEQKKQSYSIINNYTNQMTEIKIEQVELTVEKFGNDFLNHIDVFDFPEEQTDYKKIEMKESNRQNGAPLPFQGQKRNFINKFVEELKNNFDDTYIYVDLFGGSGLLSHHIKKTFPNAEVIYNDFDDYKKRCDNVSITNEVINKISSFCENYKKEERIKFKTKTKIIDYLKEMEYKHGDNLDVLTISTQLLFSSDFSRTLENLEKSSFYNRIITNLYNEEFAKNFHAGLKIVKSDYKQLIEEYKNKKVVFVADPPYLSTSAESYTDNTWKLTKYLEINSQLKNKDIIFFTSEKSELLELDTWLKKEMGSGIFSDNIKTFFTNVAIAKDRKYKDIMIFSKKEW